MTSRLRPIVVRIAILVAIACAFAPASLLAGERPWKAASNRGDERSVELHQADRAVGVALAGHRAKSEVQSRSLRESGRPPGAGARGPASFGLGSGGSAGDPPSFEPPCAVDAFSIASLLLSERATSRARLSSVGVRHVARAWEALLPVGSNAPPAA